jgi:spore germination cell wall hydrolase CwlJ-like protein
MRVLLFWSLVIFIANLFTVGVASAKNPVSNKKELQCLAQNVYFEARGEPAAGQLAIALVTMHRVKSRRYPNTICNVVWQRKQFSWTHDGKSDRPRELLAWKRAKQIAAFIYNKYWSLPARSRGALDITNGALHYYAPDLASPYWAKVKIKTREIGGHIFLREMSRRERRKFLNT